MGTTLTDADRRHTTDRAGGAGAVLPDVASGTTEAGTTQADRPDRGHTMSSPSDPSDPGRRPRRRRARRLVAICTALVVLLGVGLTAGYLAFLGVTIDTNVTRARLLPVSAPEGAPAADVPPTYATGALNVLLIGSDPRANGERGRSDVMLLAHVRADRSAIDLVHFPRDLYVPIPGRPGRDKLNAAYAYGGAPLLVSTLQQLLRARIDHVAMIDMGGFRDMIDALGGVRVQVDEASPGFAVGPMDMDGEQALRFVRERKHLSEGDISRGWREQAVMQSLLERALSRQTLTNPVTFARFVERTSAHLTLDESLTSGYLREQALSLRDLRADDVITYTAPYAGFAMTAQGASIVTADDAGLRRLGEALREDAMAEYQ